MSRWAFSSITSIVPPSRLAPKPNEEEEEEEEDRDVNVDVDVNLDVGNLGCMVDVVMGVVGLVFLLESSNGSEEGVVVKADVDMGDRNPHMIPIIKGENFMIFMNNYFAWE